MSDISITESQISDLDHTDTDAFHDDESGEINAVTEKATPVSADIILIEDSAASYAKKKVQMANLPSGSLANLTDTTIASLLHHEALEVSARTRKSPRKRGSSSSL